MIFYQQRFIIIYNQNLIYYCLSIHQFKTCHSQHVYTHCQSSNEVRLVPISQSHHFQGTQAPFSFVLLISQTQMFGDCHGQGHFFRSNENFIQYNLLYLSRTGLFKRTVVVPILAVITFEYCSDSPVSC